MAVEVTQAIQDLIQRILNDRDTAVQYSEDPEGTLAAEGITEGDVSGLDMYQVVRDTCGSTVPGLRDYGPSSGPAGGATGGGPTPPPASSSGSSSMDHVVQHMNYVTYETYKDDENIVQNIDNSTNIEDNSTNIDQSQNTEVDVDTGIDGQVGDVNVDVDSNDTNVNATGDGSAASGVGPAVSGDGSAATGSGPATVGDDNLVNTGTNSGQQNTGDRAAQAVSEGGSGGFGGDGGDGGGGGLFGSGGDGGSGGSADGGDGGDIVLNTGDGGVTAGADVEAPVNTGEFTGVQAEGNVDAQDAALGFGEGDTSKIDVTSEVNDVDAQNSNVQTEQGEGDASQQDLVDVNPAGAAFPVEEIAEVETAPQAEALEGEEEELQI